MGIRLKLYKQSKRMCGPTSLKIVLSYYGLNKTEKDIKKLTKSTYFSGTSVKNMINASKKLGFKANYKSNFSMNKLKDLINNKIPVIIGWYSPYSASHFSVVSAIDKDKIHIADPEIGKIRVFTIKNFEEWWLDINWDKLSFSKKLMFSINFFSQSLMLKIFGKKYTFPTNKESNIIRREVIIIKKQKTKMI